MAIPEASLSIRDGGLGLADGENNGIVALIGACSSGTANTPYEFTDAQTARDTLGSGPMVELGARILALAGGPVVFVKAPSSTAGAAAAPVATKTGTATLGTPAGGSLDAVDGIVTIVAAGATLVAGTATFKYSLDGGRTYSPEIALPVSGVYAIPNSGLTLTWTYTSGTAFVAGDSWTFTATGPSYTLSEATTAIDALIADASKSFFLVHVVGPASTAANAATMFAAIEAKMVAAATSNYRYARAIIETPDVSDATLQAAFLTTAGTRTMVSGGWAYMTSQTNGVAFKRPIAWQVSTRAAQVPPNEDLGRVRTGPDTGIVSLVRDEYKTPGLDASGFVTSRTHVGKTGFYLTHGRLMVAAGSDFKYLQYGRVMDIACAEIRAAQLEFLNDSVRVTRSTGRILEIDANNVESYIEGRVRSKVTEPGYASSVSVEVERTTNVLTTQKLVVRYRIVPLAYFKTIEGEVAFTNPAIQPV